jgi:hypothetical protein
VGSESDWQPVAFVIDNGKSGRRLERRETLKVAIIPADDRARLVSGSPGRIERLETDGTIDPQLEALWSNLECFF